MTQRTKLSLPVSVMFTPVTVSKATDCSYDKVRVVTAEFDTMSGETFE